MANFTIELLDAVRDQTETKSDYAAAKVLKITRQAASAYRTGIRQMDDEPAIKAAELLGIDPVQVLARLHIERSKSEKARQVWSRISDLAKSAACVLLTAGALMVAHSPVSAGVSAAGGAAHCILCQVRQAILFVLRCAASTAAWPSRRFRFV